MRELRAIGVFKVLLVGIIAIIPMAPVILLVGINAGTSSGEAARVERLPPLNASRLRQMSPGSEVLIEGRISDAAPARFRSFVAYVREKHYLDADLSDTWRVEEWVTSPFLLDAPDGQIETMGGSYRLLNPTASWIAPGTTRTNPMRYTGFEIGDSVVVIGTLIQTPDGVAVRADTVIGGTRDAYLAAQQGSLTSSALMSGVLILVVLLVVATVYTARRRAASARSAEMTSAASML